MVALGLLNTLGCGGLPQKTKSPSPRGARRYLLVPHLPAQLRPSSRPLPWDTSPSADPARSPAHHFLPLPTSPHAALGLVAHASNLAGAHAGHTKKRKTRRSPCLSSGGAGNRTQVREASSSSSFTCVAAVTPAAGLVDSATTYPPLISATLSGAPLRYPALVVDAFGVLGRPSPRTALRFLRPRERARCRSHVSRPA